MLNLILFEIDCAEKTGSYRIADQLQQKLIKIATEEEEFEKFFRENKSPEDFTLENLEYEDSDREPTEEELRYTAEHPADETDDDFEGLYIQEAREHLKKLGLI